MPGVETPGYYRQSLRDAVHLLMQGLPGRRGMLWKAGQSAFGAGETPPLRENNPMEQGKKPLHRAEMVLEREKASLKQAEMLLKWYKTTLQEEKVVLER
ncbi:MAG: hypothetical protein WGN25_11815 [Candidatus Electrothrix sp. GW3-4]|uniref:hypothetical protein n=1 Tax=Candidatus Electrothrix sp. GW3-4 TaxID=3126740 RepID=UPI0030CDB07B